MAPEAAKRDFHGRGWAFPVGATPGGGIAMAEGDEDIKQAIHILLGTALGERAMRPDFGSPVHEMVFDPADAALTGKVRFYVRNALERWEPRIEVERVGAHVERNVLLVGVEYTVRRTNRQDNLVFPYYLQGERQGVRP
jgi:phage baseplate assembly protein W